jgi:hypothetical protein
MGIKLIALVLLLLLLLIAFTSSKKSTTQVNQFQNQSGLVMNRSRAKTQSAKLDSKSTSKTEWPVVVDQLQHQKRNGLGGEWIKSKKSRPGEGVGKATKSRPKKTAPASWNGFLQRYSTTSPDYPLQQIVVVITNELPGGLEHAQSPQGSPNVAQNI